MLILTIFCVGCTLFGATPKAPTAVESTLFNVQTNFVTNSVTQTNLVTQVVPEVQMVTVTNQQNQVITTTNTVELTNTTTQVVQVTNVTPQYTYTTGATTTATVQAAGSVLNSIVPGVGGIASAGILALLALWAQLRSTKNSTTAGTLAQEVETLLEFINTLPNGSNYTTVITSWLQSHQVDAGVANTILGLLENQVSNPNAKAAVAEIQGTLSALTSAAPVTTTVTPAPTATKT